RQPCPPDRGHGLAARNPDRADARRSAGVLAPGAGVTQVSMPPGQRAKPEHSETARQIVHMAMGGFAMLLRWIAWWQAMARASFALLFNLLVLPRIGGAIYRPGDRERGLHGILFYPLAVLLLLVAFPRRLDIAAAAWGILAIGDGIATLVGRAV